jgi:hypothetical protein
MRADRFATGESAPIVGLSAMTQPRRIEGYAIVSEDGMLADAAGIMPDTLKFEADRRFFERGLDGVDVVIHGRHSHEHQPHSDQRRRLVVTRTAAALAPDPDYPRAMYWNPAGATLEQALAAVGAPEAVIGVVGATEVFGMFLDLYDVFHLSRAAKVRLPGGRPVFPGVPALTPDAVLARHGMTPGERQVLDPALGVTLVSWRR